MMTLIALILGLIIGTMMIFASVYVFLKYRIFSLGGSVLTVLGAVLLGMSIWQSIEVSVGPEGGFTAKFSQDLGAATAEIKGKIAQIERKLQEITDDLASLRKRYPEVRLSEEAASKRAAEERAFQENSKYSVLVFYKSQQQIVAKTIEKVLLSEGYNSSSTATDLKESKKQFVPRHVWVIYTEKGMSKLADIETILNKLNLGLTLHVEPQVVQLRQGDIQILVF
jgi:Skp family chaperone for outer membrane proteins